MKKRKLNKKADQFLLGTVSIKLLIALVCLVILIYVGALLYGVLVKDPETKTAEERLTDLQNKINIYSEQQTNQDLEVLFFPPTNEWVLVNFREGNFPEGQCVGRYENCLCLCKDLTCEKGEFIGTEKNSKGTVRIYEGINPKCGKLRACLGHSENINILGDHQIPGAEGSAPHRYKTKTLCENTIGFPEIPEELTISKQDGGLIIKKSPEENNE